MATKRWRGTATAVKQVSTITITAFDAATTYKVTIGGVEITQVGTTDANTTATNLKNSLAASTHPYFDFITWTVATNVITGTADTAGVPFVFTASVSGGTGTISQATTTASSGPNDWSTADNWDPSGVPASSDDVFIEDNAVNIMWGLDQNAVDLDELVIRQSYTGKIGLNAKQFATSSDGDTTNTSKPEYRQDYLKIGWATGHIGQSYGPSAAAGSQRLKLNNDKAAAAVTTVHGTAAAASETNLPALRLLLNHANHDLYVRSAPGGVGVAVEKASETSTCGLVSVSDTGSSSRVSLGAGVTLTNYEQLGGANILQAATTVTGVTVKGGSLQLEGDYTVTTMTVEAGTVLDNHQKTAGNVITTLNANGGTLDFRGSSQDRTVGTLNLADGATLHADGAVMTFTVRNLPSGLFSLAVS